MPIHIYIYYIITIIIYFYQLFELDKIQVKPIQLHQ